MNQLVFEIVLVAEITMLFLMVTFNSLVQSYYFHSCILPGLRYLQMFSIGVKSRLKTGQSKPLIFQMESHCFVLWELWISSVMLKFSLRTPKMPPNGNRCCANLSFTEESRWLFPEVMPSNNTSHQDHLDSHFFLSLNNMVSHHTRKFRNGASEKEGKNNQKGN